MGCMKKEAVKTLLPKMPLADLGNLFKGFQNSLSESEKHISRKLGHDICSFFPLQEA